MRYRPHHILPFLCLLFVQTLFAQPELIIPRPASMTALGEDPVPLGKEIRYDTAFAAQAAYLRDLLKQQFGEELATTGMAGKAGIRLSMDPSIKNPEAYRLEASGKQGIVLAASGIKGIVNGIQTLIQLLPMNRTGMLQVPAVRIEDYPRFAYRGMHLDVVRHFFPVDYIKKYIDYLAFHKFNSFHWHLTDDQGWRIEMKSYPRLNEIGSWREETLIGHFKDEPARYDGTRYGGYYTREEIKDVLAYAAVRGINIIPEIDIPGHSRAIIASYPELSTRPDTTWKVATTWGMYNRQNNVLAPRPETFVFLRTVFHEIADLFPSEYIHVGGDECSKLWWKQDPFTQQFMKQKGLKNEAALQTYFIETVAGYLAEKNKKTIGWHEVMEGELDKNTVVMNWATEKTAVAAAKKGYRVIMTPGKPLYFDHYQSSQPGDSLAIHGYNSLEAVYRFDPVPASLKPSEASAILGAQANVWTEYMAYPSKVDYMIFPRMTALSEALWTPADKKDYDDFLERINRNMIPRYRLWNSSYYTEAGR
ncbi:MAG TPA: beta-N-acetylhexosaminidase [Flavisolibacter sp.]|nr:beta-N-acetylhexosaminidase [Flavisolibacter sp.]